MEIHLQQCQNCGSRNLRNILAREPGENDKVFAQCRDCQAFVASYSLSPMGYYHDRKGYESFLRSIQRSGEFMSGRNLADLYRERMNRERAQFERVLDTLKKRDARRAAQEEE